MADPVTFTATKMSPNGVSTPDGRYASSLINTAVYTCHVTACVFIFRSIFFSFMHIIQRFPSRPDYTGGVSAAFLSRLSHIRDVANTLHF